MPQSHVADEASPPHRSPRDHSKVGKAELVDERMSHVPSSIRDLLRRSANVPAYLKRARGLDLAEAVLPDAVRAIRVRFICN